jgi:hypothetical protein
MLPEGNTLEEDYEFGYFHGGRRYKKKNIGARREEPDSDPEV